MKLLENDTFVPVNQPEYSKHFWDYLMGRNEHEQFLSLGKAVNSTYVLPTLDQRKFDEKLKAESLVRNLATCLYAPNGPSRILAKVNTDSATWVSAGEEIPAYEGIQDFTTYGVNEHKLAVVLKMDDSFLHDNYPCFENYVQDRLAKDFAHAEEAAFIAGKGEKEPVGIINDEGGASAGAVADSLTYDSILELFFSLDKDYRKNAVWIMNDDTALKVRKLKDEDGNLLWNGDPDNLLGRKVFISNYMPDAEAGKKPVAFGDFSYYWLVDRAVMSVRTLHEKFFEEGQIGYLAYERLDGKLIRPDAVKVLSISRAQ